MVVTVAQTNAHYTRI